jgi:hypothetical protein
VARADGIVVAPIGTDAQGIPIFERPLPQGFFVVAEARPGVSGRPVGQTTFNWNSADPNLLPDFQLVSKNELGDGSTKVCDDGTIPPAGGVPAVDPPQFGGSQFIANAINDLGCRFNARPSSGDACTKDVFGVAKYVNPVSTMQFCPQVGIGAEIAFPVGDTLLSLRLRDVQGRPGPTAQIIIRVLP